VAARAGVQEPWGWSLRELSWRANALAADAWDRTAWVCLHTLRPHMKDPPQVPLNPFRDRGQSTSLSEFEKMREAKVLPEKLSEEEKEARWQAHLRREQERDHGCK
jgi:hypothetical protein